jgi:hypothetical protein
MKMNTTAISTALAAGLLVSSNALAQDLSVGANASAEAETGEAPEASAEVAAEEEAAPEEAEPEEAPAPEPEEEVAAEEAEPEEAAEPAAEEAAEEESGGTPGWFRIDSDGLGLQLWAGATHTIGGIGIATDMYVTSGTFGEFDIGVEIPAGPVLFIPMVGIGVDWGARDVSTLVAPQLFTYADFDPIYIEWWSQFFLDAFDKGTGNLWYNRLFALYNVSDEVALGPQAELTLDLDAGDPLVSLPIGARMNLGYGENNTFGLFAGYETENGDGPALAGRLTFVRTW